jgi:DNA adenine methylase
MDPPYKGTSGQKDTRYYDQMETETLITAMQDLNERDIPFILSYDGKLGNKEYSTKLPKSLALKKMDIHAGRSAQSPLLGREEETIESLYLSPALIRKLESADHKRKIDTLE